MDAKELLGLKIKEFRKQKKLTQEQLAEVLDLDIGYISKLEVGRNFPTIGTRKRLHRHWMLNFMSCFSIQVLKIKILGQK